MLKTPAKKAIAAVTLALPLALVACGSDNADSSDASTTLTSESTTTSTEETTEETTEESEETEDDNADEENPDEGNDDPDSPDTQAAAAAPRDGGAPEIQPLPEGALEGVEQQPLEGGNPAPEADVAAIRGLVEGFHAPITADNVQERSVFVVENTCQSVLQRSGADAYSADMLRGMQITPEEKRLLEQSGFFSNQPTVSVDSIDNVVVDGGRASATVSVTSNGQSDTSTMRFLHEDGRWKMCDDQA